MEGDWSVLASGSVKGGDAFRLWSDAIASGDAVSCIGTGGDVMVRVGTTLGEVGVIGGVGTMGKVGTMGGVGTIGGVGAVGRIIGDLARLGDPTLGGLGSKWNTAELLVDDDIAKGRSGSST